MRPHWPSRRFNGSDEDIRKLERLVQDDLTDTFAWDRLLALRNRLGLPILAKRDEFSPSSVYIYYTDQAYEARVRLEQSYLTALESTVNANPDDPASWDRLVSDRIRFGVGYRPYISRPANADSIYYSKPYTQAIIRHRVAIGDSIKDLNERVRAGGLSRDRIRRYRRLIRRGSDRTDLNWRGIGWPFGATPFDRLDWATVSEYGLRLISHSNGGSIIYYTADERGRIDGEVICGECANDMDDPENLYGADILYEGHEYCSNCNKIIGDEPEPEDES